MGNETKISETEEVMKVAKKESDTLDEVEEIMFEQVRALRKGTSVTELQLQIVDRVVKGLGIILATENLKERRYMNRTNRKEAVRKAQKD